MRISVIHGPNLNTLGSRQPEIYGSATLESIDSALKNRAQELKVQLDCFQSNSEGILIDHIQSMASASDAIIINPGGLTHSSVSLRDALLSANKPLIEVHISNIFSREEFRRHSVISDIALGVISGFGSDGYLMALEFLVRRSR